MALDFDGADDRVDHGDIAAIDGAAALSVAFWVYLQTSENGTELVGKGGAGFTIRESTSSVDDMAASFPDAATQGRTTGSIFPAGSWQHWIMVFDGAGVGNAARLQLYKDGVNQTLTFDGTIPATIGDAGTAQLQVGVNQGLNAFYADAIIAHLKIWTAALTAAEAAQEMNSYLPARTANLILWSPYDDGTNARDYSGNGNHGTVTGALAAGGPPVGHGDPVLIS